MVTRKDAVYLEYNSTIRCSSSGISISSRVGKRPTLPLISAGELSSQPTTVFCARPSAISLNIGAALLSSLRDVNPLAIDGQMSVADQLPGLIAAVGQPQTIDNIIQPAFQ